MDTFSILHRSLLRMHNDPSLSREEQEFSFKLAQTLTIVKGQAQDADAIAHNTFTNRENSACENLRQNGKKSATATQPFPIPLDQVHNKPIKEPDGYVHMCPDCGARWDIRFPERAKGHE